MGDRQQRQARRGPKAPRRLPGHRVKGRRSPRAAAWPEEAPRSPSRPWPRLGRLLPPARTGASSHPRVTVRARDPRRRRGGGGGGPQALLPRLAPCQCSLGKKAKAVPDFADPTTGFAIKDIAKERADLLKRGYELVGGGKPETASRNCRPGPRRSGSNGVATAAAASCSASPATVSGDRVSSPAEEPEEAKPATPAGGAGGEDQLRHDRHRHRRRFTSADSAQCRHTPRLRLTSASVLSR